MAVNTIDKLQFLSFIIASDMGQSGNVTDGQTDRSMDRSNT